MAVTPAAILAALRDLGLAGRVVGVHASLRSFGRIEGGAATVVTAFLDAGCTLLVPAHWDGRRTRPLPHQHYRRNGSSPSFVRDLLASEPAPFDPFAVDPDMGVLPATVVRWPGACRGRHACLSFAAIGPLAAALVAEQTPAAPYRPVEAVIARQGAWLLLGVGLTSLTALHLAEERAGRVPFRRWMIDERGVHVEFAAGGCSGGFERLAPAVAHLEQVVHVGPSRWRCYAPAGAVVDAAAAAIRADPGITHCGNAACDRCRDAVRGGFLP